MKQNFWLIGHLGVVARRGKRESCAEGNISEHAIGHKKKMVYRNLKCRDTLQYVA